MKKGIALFLILLLCFPSVALAEGSQGGEMKIQFKSSKITLYQEDLYTLAYTLTPEGSGMRLVWASSDPEVAQVDQQGVITALKKGSAKITAATEDGTAKATCRVTVKKLHVTPVEASIEGNVYDGSYNQLGSAAETALRKYCERLGNSRGEKIVRTAVEKLGTSYETMDCSQLAQYAYKANGIRISRTSGTQAQDMEKYEREDGKPRVGDLIFLAFPAWRECGCGGECRRYRKVHHVAVYLGNVDGTNYVVDSSSYYGHVIIRSYSGNSIAGMDIVFAAGK
ncbi:MAG: NlpC/P60 family protein [Candidatus Pelethousia sp.]|nr:NlpC/P60 family protein [Candidatus Pelethousia sp.]